MLAVLRRFRLLLIILLIIMVMAVVLGFYISRSSGKIPQRGVFVLGESFLKA